MKLTKEAKSKIDKYFDGKSAEEIWELSIKYCSCLTPIPGMDRTDGYSCQFCCRKIKDG